MIAGREGRKNVKYESTDGALLAKVLDLLDGAGGCPHRNRRKRRDFSIEHGKKTAGRQPSAWTMHIISIFLLWKVAVGG